MSAYLYAATRTPFGRFGGALAGVRPDDLAAGAIEATLAATPDLDPGSVDEVVWGNANGAGEENRNVGRMAALLAGLPTSVPGTTVNRLCGSSLDAAMLGSRSIETGDADVVLIGGVESMTRAPHLLMGSRDGWTYGSVEVLDHMAYDGLTDAYDRESMGASTERHNARYELTREAQDTVAALSHQPLGLLHPGELLP